MRITKPESVEYVVAIGASAGGLIPLQELVDALPESIDNVAIVIAQHLSPEYKSMLAEIIGRKTSLSTTTIESGVEIASNHVYVVPPNCDVVIRNRCLEIIEASEGGPRPSIDRLFASLAKEFGRKAVGIILSGTGQDGSRGIVEIKKNGGFAICQDMNTARYTGMPQAALGTGVIDVVMPPAQIGEKLIELLYFGRPAEAVVVKGEDEQIEPGEDISELLSLLAARLGTDFSNYKSSTIIRRVEKRLNDMQFETVAEYLTYIRSNESEIDEFYQYLLIGVTSFFRDPHAFDALRKELRTLITQKESKGTLRVWVPGCATGEESVSIAILIHELFQEVHRYDIKLQIFATDIDNKALKYARRGVYSRAKVEKLPPELRARYFHRIDASYEITLDLKSSILYTHHDLTRNPPFLRLDLISCRNLFIYFNQRLQNHIFPIFQYALQSGGILFLGKSESVGNYKTVFATVDAKHRIFMRKDRDVDQPLRLPSTKPMVIEKMSSTRTGINTTRFSFRDMVKETLYSTYEDPYVIIDESSEIIEICGAVQAYLSIKTGHPTMNLMRLINEELHLEVRFLVTESIKSRKITRGRITRVVNKEGQHLLRISVKPLLHAKPDNPYFMVIFEVLDVLEPFLPEDGQAKMAMADTKRIEELEYELLTNRQHTSTLIEELETANEELQALNEELQSSNEELQASNEELETSNEELQATNEELENAYVDLRTTSQKLSRQKYLWEQMALTSPDLIAVLRGDDYIFEFVNTAYQALFANKKLEGRSVMSVIPEIAMQGFHELLNSVRATGKAYQGYEVPVMMEAADGGQPEVRYFNFTYAPLVPSDGEGPDIIVYATETTKAVRERETAENNAHFFSTLADGMAQKVWTVDAANATTYMNQTLRNFVDCQNEDCAQINMEEYIHPDDLGYTTEFWEKARTQKEGFRVQYRLRNAQDEYSWHLIRCVPMMNDKGKITTWICTATDIHEEKTVEQKKDEFMSIASHELKTPLTTIMGYVELLQDVLEEDDCETARIYIKKARSGLNRISSLVADLLDVTRIETGVLKFSRSYVQFEKLVQEVIEEFSPLYASHTIECQLSDIQGVMVYADQMRLSQVITNMISNAIKYSPDADKVMVRAYLQEKQVVLEVQDFGVGVPHAFRSKIFERFFRVNENTGFASGLGIGLYISRQIMARHDGIIAVKESSEKGSTFYIQMPIVQ